MFKLVLSLVLSAFLTTTSLLGQTKLSYEWFLSESKGGLCNQSLILFSDSTYCSEAGCEASSRFSFGKWSQKKNIITFTPVNTSTFRFIEKVERDFTNSKNMAVILFDKYGNNITDKIVVGQYVEGKGMYSMELDSTNTKRTGIKRDKALLVITTLQRFTKQKLAVDMDSSSNYKIYLNVLGDWNFHKNSTWDNNETFRLNEKDDRLISLVPDRFEGDKILYTEFIRQKK
jgi:hypothetical protein